MLLFMWPTTANPELGHTIVLLSVNMHVCDTFFDWQKFDPA